MTIQQFTLYLIGLVFLFVLALTQFVGAAQDEHTAYDSWSQSDASACHSITEDSIIYDCDYNGATNAWAKQ